MIGSAILANALNPKLTVFFFAFLPQFVPPHAPHEVLRGARRQARGDVSVDAP